MIELSKNEIRLLGAIVAWHGVGGAQGSGTTMFDGPTRRVFVAGGVPAAFPRSLQSLHQLADLPGARVFDEEIAGEYGWLITAFKLDPPIPARLYCPKCDVQHLDVGERAERPHYKHLCLSCGFIWRVEPYVFGARQSNHPNIRTPPEKK